MTAFPIQLEVASPGERCEPGACWGPREARCNTRSGSLLDFPSYRGVLQEDREPVLGGKKLLTPFRHLAALPKRVPRRDGEVDRYGGLCPCDESSQLAGLAFVILGIYLIVESRNLQYYTDTGPGSGFFPFWLGVVLALVSGIWVARVSLGPAEPMPADFVPPRSGAIRVVVVLVALALFGWLVDIVGFQLMMLAFLVFVMAVLGRKEIPVTAVIAIAGSFGLYYVFKNWLDVSLPASSIDVLRNLGL